MTERYETLRAAALGDRLPLEARSGLALLVRRGMWAWARAATPPGPAPQPRQWPFRHSSSDDDQRTVVRLLAALAMGPNEVQPPRTHERIVEGPGVSSRT